MQASLATPKRSKPPSRFAASVSNLVVLRRRAKGDKVELDALSELDDALDVFDRVLIVVTGQYLFGNSGGKRRMRKRTSSKPTVIFPWLIGLFRRPSSSMREPSMSTKVTKCRSVSSSRAGACKEGEKRRASVLTQHGHPIVLFLRRSDETPQERWRRRRTAVCPV
jgi:hypothetical protein